MAFEKMKQEIMHIVPDLCSSCTGIVSDIVRCRKCIWYGRTWRFGSWLHVFGEFQARSRKTPISCMSVRPFVCICHCRLSVDGFFRGIWYWEILRKSVEKLHIWLQYRTWRRKYVYIVAISTKYFVLRKECIGNPLLHFISNTEHFYFVGSYCRPTAIKRGCTVACPWQWWLRHCPTVLRYSHMTHLVSVKSGSISADVSNETGQCAVPSRLLILRIQHFSCSSEELNFPLFVVVCIKSSHEVSSFVSKDWTDSTKLSEIYTSCTSVVGFVALTCDNSSVKKKKVT